MSTVKPQLFISDQRMLELMEFAISNKFAESQKDWALKVGINPNNVAQVRSGRQGFTDEHKLAAVEMVGANMNWLYGLESNMLRLNKKMSALDLIKEGVRMLDKKR